jgi:hypothetical protein
VKTNALGYLLLSSIFVIVSACGYKTNPRPATAAVPAEVGLVHAQAYKDRIVLKWDIPTKNTDGSRLTDLSGFKVYRVVKKTGEDCDNCEDKKTLLANVDYQNPSNATVEKGVVTFTDNAVSHGNVYYYFVSAYNLRGEESRPSQEVAVAFEKAPEAPENLKASVDSRGVHLEWSAPPNDQAIKNYRIYRSDASNPSDMKLIGNAKWGENSFRDKTAELGKTYQYAVSSLTMNRGISTESDPSAPVTVYYSAIHGMPPENVNTLVTRDGIRIYWDPVKIPGEETRYNIYRSEGRKMFEKINTQPLANPLYFDKKVVKGREYRYAVTAFSKNRPEQESSRSGTSAIIFKP